MTNDQRLNRLERVVKLMYRKGRRARTMINGHERTFKENEELMRMVISGHIEAKDRLDKQAEESAKWREESRRESAEIFELFRKSDEKIDKLSEKHERLAEAQAQAQAELTQAQLVADRKWTEAQHRLAQAQAELAQAQAVTERELNESYNRLAEAQLISERKLAALIDRSGTP
jgi:hypothetical protein